MAQRSLHILLVEDHFDTSEIMRRLLEMKGHRVSLATSVASAVETVKTCEPIDLLISDLGLPDGSGLDAFRQISETHSFVGIALSGYGMEEDVRRSLDAGFASHLTKPVDFAQLDQEITKLFS